jgi:dienelactone hydrolase
MVPAEQVTAFKQQMDAAGAKYSVVSYPGVKHSFTNPQADEYAKRFGLPVAYDAKADADSWAQTQIFLKDIFAGK